MEYKIKAEGCAAWRWRKGIAPEGEADTSFGPSAERVGLDDRADNASAWADMELDVQRGKAVSVAAIKAGLKKLENLAEVVLVGQGNRGKVVPSGALGLA